MREKLPRWIIWFNVTQEELEIHMKINDRKLYYEYISKLKNENYIKEMKVFGESNNKYWILI